MKALLIALCMLVSVEALANPICSFAADEAVRAHMDMLKSTDPESLLQQYIKGSKYTNDYSLGVRLYVARWTDDHNLLKTKVSVIEKDIYGYCAGVIPLLEDLKHAKTVKDFYKEESTCDNIVLGGIYSVILMYNNITSIIAMNEEYVDVPTTKLRTNEDMILNGFVEDEDTPISTEQARLVLLGMNLFASKRAAYLKYVINTVVTSDSLDIENEIQETIAADMIVHCSALSKTLSKKFM